MSHAVAAEVGVAGAGMERNTKLAAFTHAAATGTLAPVAPQQQHVQVVPQQHIEAQGLPSPSAVAATTPPAEEKEPLRITVDRCGSQERLRWTPQLHQRFCEATAALGGAPFAKPKDIVVKMNVPGLTLAHVKSHLQKYRQQEGVAYVPRLMRAPGAAAARVSGRQQQLSKHPFFSPGSGSNMGPGSACNSSDSTDAPPAKRARAGASAGTSRDRSAEQGQPNGGPVAAAAPGAAMLLKHAAAPPPPPPAALAAAPVALVAGPAALVAAPAPALQFDQYLKSLSTLRVEPPPLPVREDVAPPPLPTREAVAAEPLELPSGGAVAPLDRLQALAELASKQYDELLSAQHQIEEQKACLAPLAEKLAALPSQAQWPAQASTLQPRLDALVRQQARMHAFVQQHLGQGTRVMDELRAFQRGARELLAQAAVAPRPPPAPAPAPAPQPQTLPPEFASRFMAAMTAAAGSGHCSPALAPQHLPASSAAAAGGLSQAQQLYHNALLAARQTA